MTAAAPPPPPPPTTSAPPEAGALEKLRARGRRRGPRPAGRPGPWVFVASWGPCGYAPVAPGTWGTLGAIPLYWALSFVGVPAYLVAVLVLGLVSGWSAQQAGRYWKVADASPIVIDEVVGYLVTMAFVPFSWPAAILGFFLFRLFDVTKPWPASAFDRMKNGFGVTMDDVAAGVFACASMHLVAFALRAITGCGSADPSWWCAVAP